MPADATRADEEIRHLRSSINDLISLQTLPAIWDGRESGSIVGTLLDVLVSVLRLNFAYARLSNSINGSPVEFLQLAQRRAPPPQPQEIGRALDCWLTNHSANAPLTVPNPADDGDVRIVPLRLGLMDEIGVLVAGSKRADFPTPTETLLLRVAANQALVALQEARQLHEQKRAAKELERRVADRTAQLTTVNEALRESEQRLRQAEKMEAVGRLAGGIAHDFNNILGAILGYGELAQKGAPEGSEMRRYLDNVMHAGGRARSLVERILLFSRSGVGERGLINVQAVIDEALELLATSLAPEVRLAKHLAAGDAAIIGDSTQLHQIAMNLCTNAAHAMAHGGELEVSLDRAEVTHDRRLSHGNLAPGIYVRLCVSDTGSGIPPPVLDRMFDPFFTTKGTGDGTGLGLSLVHGIVADLRGAIDVRTTLGQGTTFTIWLPHAGEGAAPSIAVTTESPHGNGQTVMIVDDEEALVALAEENLAALGYEPVGFNSSTAALDAFRAAPRRFDIVLTDETMPGLTGTELAREIRLLRPDIPIVLMSGYSSAPLDERARAVGAREVLRKPLQSKDIAECFGRVLR